MPHGQFASVAIGVTLLAGLGLRGGFLPLARALVSALTWGVMLFALWFGYGHREALSGLLAQALDTLERRTAGRQRERRGDHSQSGSAARSWCRPRSTTDR